jgi:hypothetical protein
MKCHDHQRRARLANIQMRVIVALEYISHPFVPEEEEE